MADVPVSIRGWESHQTEAGAVYSLSYLTPKGMTAAQDRAAFDLLVGEKGITAAGGLLALGLTVPNGAIRRVSAEVVEFWVVTSQGGRLGAMLLESLRPPGTPAQAYVLKVVNRWRSTANVATIGLAKAADAITNVAGSSIDNADAARAGKAIVEDLKDSFNDGLDLGKKVGDAALPSFGDLILPIAIGLALVVAVKELVRA